MKLIPIFISMAALTMPVVAAADPSGSPVMPNSAPAATESGVPASVVFPDPSAPLGSPQNPVPQASPTSADQASALQAGDPTVVSNGPVADTKANRAKYGQPMSQGGRQTQPAGD